MPSAGAPSVDAFDALLEQPAPAPATSTEHHDHAAHAEGHAHSHGSVEPGSQTSLSQFIDNWGLYGDPVLCGVLAGVGLGGLGIFVVLRRAVFVTAALSQAAALGVALAFYAQIHLSLEVPPVLGALLASILATLLCAARPLLRVARETLVGFVFVGASALAVLLGDRIAQEAHDIASILFGTAVLVRPLDLAFVSAGTALSLLAVFFMGRGLTFAGFDPEGARVQGLPVRAIEITFWVLFAFQVSVTTRALGALPVFGFSVLPAAAGLMLASRLRTALGIAIVMGGVSAGLGYLFAFLLELPVGASQTATAALFLLISAAIARLRR
jgi:zinc transport system permease protein